MYLLDTKVLSELRAGKPKQSMAVRQWADGIQVNQMYLAAVSLLELEIGVLRLEKRDTLQASVLRRWLGEVIKAFDGRVLAFDHRAALLCAPINVPDQRSFRDAMIAASALQHRLTLVTRNTTDFEGLGVRVINPWL